MKSILMLVLSAAVLFSMLLSGCGSQIKANTDSAKAISVDVGQEFIIALGSNPTTGYSWQPEFDSNNLALTNKEYKADDTTGKQIVGAGGTEYFHFKALKNGESTIKFTYYRPWETPAPEDQTQTFTVNVK